MRCTYETMRMITKYARSNLWGPSGGGYLPGLVWRAGWDAEARGEGEHAGVQQPSAHIVDDGRPRRNRRRGASLPSAGRIPRPLYGCSSFVCMYLAIIKLVLVFIVVVIHSSHGSPPAPVPVRAAVGMLSHEASSVGSGTQSIVRPHRSLGPTPSHWPLQSRPDLSAPNHGCRSTKTRGQPLW